MMEYIEKISGKRLFELFNGLKKNKTSIRISLQDMKFERLTMVLETRKSGRKSYFLIDYPQGFREAVARMDAWNLKVEFVGEDRIPHLFRTSEGMFEKGEAWIRFPDFVERMQRRRHYRMTAPPGTVINYGMYQRGRGMDVINVSEGGAFVTTSGSPSIRPDGRLKNLELVFPSQGEEFVEKIRIKDTKIITVEEDSSPYRYRCRLEFKKIEKEEQAILRSLIYKFQRQILRQKELMKTSEETS